MPDHENSHQRAIAAVILAQIQAGQPFTFRYPDGSDVGVTRTVLPTLLFCLDYFTYYQFRTD